MSSNHDFLPSREAEFAEFCERVIAALKDSANATAFGWDKDEAASLAASLEAFLTARDEYLKDDSTKNLLKKKGALKTAKAGIRAFVNYWVRYNKNMRTEDRLVFNVRERAPAAAPGAAPESYPLAEADTSIIRQVTIHFRDSVTKKRGKPRGIHGAEIRWALLDHLPTDVEELRHSDFDTGSPLTLVFDESDRGKKLYFCPRWETNANVKGPFGEIGSAIVP